MGKVRGEGVFLLITVAFWVGLIFLVAPLVVIVGASLAPGQFMVFPPGGFSFKWYGELIASRDWVEAIRNSMIIASTSAIAATAFGTALALGIHRFRPAWGGALLGFSMLPLLIPPVVAGVAFTTFFYQLGIPPGITKIAIAHAVINGPFPLVLVYNGLERTTPEVEEAGMSLGATPLTVLRTVTFPLIANEIFAGLLFSFVLSLNEFIVAFLVSGFTVTTLPIQIMSSLRYSYSPIIAAASTVFIVGTFALMYAVDRFTRGGLWR